MNKSSLINTLKSKGAFWSYSSENLEQMPDNTLIEECLRWGDVADIMQLSKLFSAKQIKTVWKSKLCADERIYSHNYYLAAVFFGIGNPQRYIKINQKKHNRYERIKQFDASGII